MSAEGWRGDKRKTSERGYGWRWQKAREEFLRLHPLCEMCEKQKPPRVTAAAVVDHRIPHRGDQALFWDRSNWQSLCSSHHNSDKQAFERSGTIIVKVGIDGFPLNQS